MNDRNCEVIRREIEELSLNEEFSATAASHLETCAECREFHRQQTKLRQIVGSLGTVNAPADFDFRLRARLAADADRPTFRFWTVTVRGLATAAVLVVFGVGAVMIWQRAQTRDPGTTTVAVTPSQQTTTPPQHEERNPNAGSPTLGERATHAVADNTPPPQRRINREPAPKHKQPISAVDFSNVAAKVYSNNTRFEFDTDTATVFPIEASLQSLKVSLDDGRGNARTISFPTVSFGSQRVLTSGNQLAPKGGVW
ncbi:MAG TPA: hypothetical protein VLB87_10565 [Pyrinomonadaceae bacterium]|nr:hypothetical protein [Pyrinomonadaceae bacterium]